MDGRDPIGVAKLSVNLTGGDSSFTGLWTGLGWSQEGFFCGDENKENMSDVGNKDGDVVGGREASKTSEDEDCNVSLDLRLEETQIIVEDSDGKEDSCGVFSSPHRNGDSEHNLVVQDDSPLVSEDQYGECSAKPFGFNHSHSAEAVSNSFDDSVVEVISDTDSPQAKNKSIIELMDSKDDLKLELSESQSTSDKVRGSKECANNSPSHMSEILASNSLLYENVDNINKVIDDDEDVQSMLAHQSADLMDDLDDSILLFDKSTEINLLSPKKELNKSKKETWSPKKEIWSAKNEKKRKLREASLSPVEESNKKKIGLKEDLPPEDQEPVQLTKLVQDTGLDSGSDTSRPSSSHRQVESPDISCGSPIVAKEGETRNHDPATRRTSTPGSETVKKTITTVKPSILSSPQKQLRKNLRVELDAPSFEDEARVDSPTSSSHETDAQTFKAPTPVVSPGHSLGGQGIVLRIRFPAGMSENDTFEFIREHKLEVVEEEVPKIVNKRLSDVSSLSKSSSGGSSGYLGGSSSSCVTSSSDGGKSRGRSRLSIMPEETVEKHSIIAKLPNRVSVVSTEKVDENDVIDENEQMVVVHDPEVAAVEEVAYEEITNHAEINENVLNEEVENGEDKIDYNRDKLKKGKGKGKMKDQVKNNKDEVTSNTKKSKTKTENSQEKEEKTVEEKSRKKFTKKRPLNNISETETEPEPEKKEVKKAPVEIEDNSDINFDKFGPGRKVFAKWVDVTGVFFYPASIVEKVDDVQVKVRFSEDKIERVLATESDVISVLHLKPGDGVTVKHDRFQAYEVTAKLLNYPTSTDKDILYELAITATDSELQPNEDSRTVSHSEISLTDAQACSILRGRGLVPTTNKVSAEIDFENLIFGKRRARTTTPSRPVESPHTPRRKRGGENVEESATTGCESSSSTTTPAVKKNLKKVSTPNKASKSPKVSTPNSQRRKGKRMMSSDDEEEVMPKTSLRMQAAAAVAEAKYIEEPSVVSITKSSKKETSTASPASARRSSKKSNKDIFIGISFIFTSSKNTLQMTEGEEDDFTESSESTNVAPIHKFDKKKLQQMVVSYGGEVLEVYPSHSDPAPTMNRSLVTVSDHRCVTMTYLLSLADCVPIVSHVYILDCVSSSSLLDRQAYLLPAGFSSLLMQEVEQGQDCTTELRMNDCLLPVRGTRQRKEEDPVLAGRRILLGLHVLVISTVPDFTDVWQSVLNSLGAAVTTRHSTTSRLDKLRLPDVVVTDSQAPPPICQDLAARSEIPVVSTKWIIQCVVNNARVAYNNFKYKLPSV